MMIITTAIYLFIHLLIYQCPAECRVTFSSLLFIKAGHADSLCRNQHIQLSPEMDCLIKAGGGNTLVGGSEEVMGGGWAGSHLYLLSGSLIKPVAIVYSFKL